MTDIIDYKNTLLDQFEALKEFPMFQRMARTVEGSPWHREANVLVHTEMVVNEYIKRTDNFVQSLFGSGTWTRDDYLGAIACVFHDVGKPSSQIDKYSEERGHYHAYHGHDLVSAHMFQSYAAERNWFTAQDIAKVCFYIEHHMPWYHEDNEKLDNLARTALHYNAGVFCRVLLSDQAGRESDNKAENFAKSEVWVNQFIERVVRCEQHIKDSPMNQEDQDVFFMPIAPSGAGKSTYLKQLKEKHPDILVFSLDALRHEFYDTDDYAKAYQGSVDDKSFEARANARFHTMVKEGKSMYIDNTNLSAKRRKFYLRTAKKYNFFTVAVLMPVSLDVILKRQKTRGDKTVPEMAVKQQYRSLQTPLKGEFDAIVVSDHNLVK